MYTEIEELVSREVVDEYLGFDILCLAHGEYVAVAKAWTSAAVIAGANLPAVRKQIWMWWFRV